jgi:Leucine-rich repeat (LRR) protein
VLLQIKKDFNNPYLLSSWDPKTPCCGWYHIQCDEITNRVISFEVSDSRVLTNFSGHIPPSFGDLPYLESLSFHKLPYLTGPIQPAIAKLKYLKYLFIEYTNVSGPIPPFLGELKNLLLLHLSGNYLSGSIPSSLSHLPKLQSLRLDQNKLTGPIPESFGSFKKPGPDIILARNQLSGPIPASLGQIDPERIDLSRNKLVGDASLLFGSKKRTQKLDISRNLFSFDFSKVNLPIKSLIWLDINHNNIYGKLPVALAKVELQQFNVSYNKLCGEIPQGGTGRLQDSFDEYAYLHNKCLCGPPLLKCK